jgi:hypothetical protein
MRYRGIDPRKGLGQVIKNQLEQQAWWCMPGIPALRRWRQKEHKFEVSLDYIRQCLKKIKEG